MPFMRRYIPSLQREINDLKPPACFYYALKSVNLTVPFLDIHAAVYNLFNLGRHLVSAAHYRLFRMRAFASWQCSVE